MGKKKKCIEFPDPEEITEVGTKLEKKLKLKGELVCESFGYGHDAEEPACELCDSDCPEYYRACETFTLKEDKAIRETKLAQARKRKPKNEEEEADTMGKKKNEEEIEEKKSKKKGKKGKKVKTEKKNKKKGSKKVKAEKKGKKGKSTKSKKSGSGKTNLRQYMKDLMEKGKSDKVVVSKATALLMKEKGYDEDHATKRVKAKLNNINNE